MTPARLEAIEEVFHAAVGCEPNQVRAFLDKRCAGDEGLRGKVEALLTSHRQAGSLIETSIAAVAANIIEKAKPDLLIGQTIGHYKISKRIGAGGMGEVYLASDITANRKAALKLLPTHLTGDPGRLKRFQQEAHAVAGLNHPNILTIYEVGAVNSNRYIASELIEGETLRERLVRGPIPVREAIEIAIQVAGALAAAHQAGIVHRDVKPENIMVRPDGYVKVLDFGIAKLAEQEVPETMAEEEAIKLVETNVGLILGTVRYMSPEQARGAPVDERTDIWSLGAVLYEMVAGRGPFTGDTPLEVMAAIVETEPPLLGKYTPQAPRELQQIVTKALQKDSRERCQSVNEMLEGLKGLRRKLEFTAELEHSAVRRLWLRWTSSPTALALTLLAAALVVAVPFYWLRNSTTTSAPPDKSVAVLAFANLSDDKENEYFSDGISEELLTVLQKIPGLHVAARTSAFSFKGKNATAQEIGQKLGVAHLVDGSVRKAGDVVRIAARLTRADTGEQLWSENFTRDLKDVFAVETELAQTIVEQLNGQLTGGAANPEVKAVIRAQVQAAQKGGTKNVDAHQHYLQGRFYANLHSEKSAGEALVEYQRAVELDPSFALAWAGLAQTHAWYCAYSGEIARAGFDDHLAHAREAAARALAIEPNLPEALLARSKIQLNFDFDWNGAAETVRRALTLAPADPALVTAAGTLAFARGDTTRAIELYRQAVALDPVNPSPRSWLAFILGITGRLAEARAEYPRVVELNPAAPWSHAGLGLAFIAKGKFEEAAVAAQDDAAEWARLVVVAMARWSQKRIPEADAALARLTEGFADTDAYHIGEVYAYRGDKDRAFEWLERARRQRDGLGFMRGDPFLANLREDPRWDVFLRKIGLADDQLK